MEPEGGDISKLIRQQRFEEVWQRFCGFLDLTLSEFMAIQERLLREQLLLASQSALGRRLIGGDLPQNVEDFRQQVRLTTYDDYAPYLSEQREEVLAEMPVAWAHTSGRTGEYKWAPYTAQAFGKIGEGMFTALILATARRRGEVRLEPGDVFVWNLAARPYISGYAAQSLTDLFDFRYVPTLEEMEATSFQERIQLGFQMGLRTGIDVLGSISSVLVKMGEQFSKGATGGGLSPALLHPLVALRLAQALVRSRLAGRPLLPKDLWRVKGIGVGGTDTDIYRAKIVEYWGVEPHENYGCTEASGVMATQAWNREGLYFLPDACFFEFIPEEEWARSRSDADYTPQTVLIDEVEAGERYEMVITNFYGGPFLRYRLYDLVRVVSLSDEETGIRLPSIAFVGRDADFIDLAGFTGLIDEKLVWQAIENASVRYVEWTIRKELTNAHPTLHLYIELATNMSEGEVAQRVHEELKLLNPFYADLERLIEVRPLHATLLLPGTFQRFMQERQAAGADLAHLKPPHMNASDAVIADLRRLSVAQAG